MRRAEHCRRTGSGFVAVASSATILGTSGAPTAAKTMVAIGRKYCTIVPSRRSTLKCAQLEYSFVSFVGGGVSAHPFSSRMKPRKPRRFLGEEKKKRLHFLPSIFCEPLAVGHGLGKKEGQGQGEEGVSLVCDHNVIKSSLCVASHHFALNL